MANNGGVSVFVNNGDGTFAPRVSYGALSTNYSTPLTMVVADLNNDGHPDLALSNPSSTGPVIVLLNKGDGTFGSHIDTAIAGFNHSIAAADFNGDGNVDLAGVSFSSSSTMVGIALGNGDGTFGSPTTLSIRG